LPVRFAVSAWLAPQIARSKAAKEESPLKIGNTSCVLLARRGRDLSAMTLLMSLAFGGVAVSILGLISLAQKRKRSNAR
jgi:hypothetical protein